MNNYPYLNDKRFLDVLFHLRVSTTYAKIVALDWQENPIEEIQGKIMSASFTFDGKSSLRRTGNLTVMIEKFDGLNDLDSIYAMNKKVNIEAGIENNTNYYTQYPILWFPMGIYVINGVGLTHDINNLTLSMQLKDKMCLLNGECGGKIPASVVFDNIDSIDQNGEPTIIKPLIYQIIQQLVNHFGGQQLGKIIIEDIDTRTKQVMKWIGSSPLYMVQKGIQYRMTLDGSEYQDWLRDDWIDVQGSPFFYGHDVGFIYTDFTYPGQLTCEAGAAITSVLDQIVAVLGNYEYFYDVYGYFHFQQIKNYLNNSQYKQFIQKINTTGNLDPSDYLLDVSNGKAVYRFENSDLIISYNNSPQYLNIKNDIVIWGKRKTSGSTERALRYHLAIDKKPKIGNTYEVFQYEDQNDGLLKWNAPIKFSSRSAFPQKGTPGLFYYANDTHKIYTWNKNDKKMYQYLQTQFQLKHVTTKDWRTELYLQGVIAEPFGIDSNYYYTELKNEWPKIYDIVPDQDGGDSGFRPQVIENFTDIDYYLDFIDTTSSVSKFSVSNIGRRGQVVNNGDVNCVFEPYIPDIVLLELSSSEQQGTDMYKARQECDRKQQAYYQVPDSIYSLLAAGGTFNSGYEQIRQLLHQYVSYNENISISCIPLYFLQPNTRIFIQDDASGIYGDYMINSISINLGSGATMNINATRALEKI